MVSVPRGVFGTDQVDVSYEPWRAVRPTPLRLGPSARAPQVRSDDGVPVGLAAGQHLGRQSTRNPGCLDSPPLRGSVDGFVWGYCLPPAVRKSGWMRVADLEPDPAFEGLACGPADADFDRRRPQACGGGHCDGRPLSGLCDASGRAVVEAQDVYLRYAPGSTPFRYLVRGDSVSRLLRSHPSWTAVEIRAGRWAGRRTRGWVLSETLRPARG
jgi:hypothetical protein